MEKSLTAKALSFIGHMVMLLLFMLIADHIMRANFDRVMVITPFLVNLAGAVVYLLVVFFFRAIFGRRPGNTAQK